MPLRLSSVSLPPLTDLSIAAPDGCVIGLIGLEKCGIAELLRLLAGDALPEAGEVDVPKPVARWEPGSKTVASDARMVLVEHALSGQDAVTRAGSVSALEQFRRTNGIVVMASHDEALLESFCDELWWLDQGRLQARGHPREVLPPYRRFVASRLRALGETLPQALRPSLRRGDGRAVVESIALRGEPGAETMVWRSGEAVTVEVLVRFQAAVPDPVVGIMIRTRIGFEVYGTNTELEKLPLGPCQAGEVRRVVFRFHCNLCPQEYTLTVASHDPDGVWHDWLEDALAFNVVDDRYTAGVANLCASVEASPA